MSRKKGGIWGGEDEKGRDKTNGPGADKDGPAQDIIHESLPRGQAEVLLQECRQKIIDGVMDEESIDKDENVQMDL